MRAYLFAFGLTALFLGLPLFLAGYVHIGCTVNTVGGMTVFTNCGGAMDLELGGAILIVAAVVFFLGSLVPNDRTRYK